MLCSWEALVGILNKQLSSSLRSFLFPDSENGDSSTVTISHGSNVLNTDHKFIRHREKGQKMKVTTLGHLSSIAKKQKSLG